MQKLRDGGPTEAEHIVVHDAWSTTESFRVVYDTPGGRRVGIVRDRRTTIDRLDVYATGDEPTPEEFGREVADFNIGEPLGRYADVLELDADGVGWWGHTALRERG
ncbi:hypothetical protein [Curtobacterium flaccumfaciens]|uniref:hypothetical protein n=1 Tax=Curtobacterium flaccumfaciens TaxID=2035 RepID=UPI0016021216|nr:hypothetical protein [Curtobacterium flaccumfaciens]MBB1198440.1 hypothetical protein [Curtobacterium flaccumfaciens]